MPIPAQCPNCERPIQLPDGAAGRSVRCPHCQKVHIAPPHPVAPAPTAGPGATVRRPTAWKGALIAAAACFAPILLAAVAVVWSSPWARPVLPDVLRDGGPDDRRPPHDTTRPPNQRDLDMLKDLPSDPPDAPGAVPPFMQIQIRSYTKAVGDLRRLWGPFQMERELDDRTRRLDLAAIDAAKPWGAYLLVDDDTPGALVGLVPVKDAVRFGNMLRDLHFIEEDRQGELVVVQCPAIESLPLVPLFIGSGPTPPPKLAYRITRGYAWFVQATDRAALEEARLVPPSQLFSEGDGADLTATMRFDRMPPAWSLLAQARLAAARQAPTAPPTEALRKYYDDPVMRKYYETVNDLLTQYALDVLQGGRRLTLRLNVDNKDQTAAADLALTANAPSRLADNIASLAAPPSRFGGLVPDDAGFGLRLNCRLPEALRASFRSAVAEVTKTVLKEAKTPQERADEERFSSALGPTVVAGEADFAYALVGGGGRPRALVGGFKVADGARLDQLLEEQWKNLPDQKDRDLWKLHVFDLGGLAVSSFRNKDIMAGFPHLGVVGDGPSYYAIGPDALYFSAGDGGKAALEQAVAAKPRRGPMAEFRMNYRRFNEVMPLQPADRDLARVLLPDAHPGRVSVSMEGGPALHLRLNMDLDLLTFMGATQSVRLGGTGP